MKCSVQNPFLPLLCWLAVPGSLWSQTPPEKSEREQIIDEVRRTLQADGAAVDPESLRKSKQKWPEYEVQIGRAMVEQDQARTEGGAALDRCLSTYESQASTYDIPVAHYLAGRIMGMAGRLDEARAHFDRAMKLDPCFFWAHHGLATYFANREMYEPAVKCYRSALDINPEFLNSSRGLAMCLLRLGKHEDAERELRKILEKHPNEVESLWTLGTVLSDAGRYLEAIEVFHQVDRIKPDFPTLKSALARCYSRADQVDKATEIYEQAIATDSRDWQSCVAMAEIHHRQGWNHKAADYLQMALDRLPVELNRDRSSIEEKIVALRARLEKEKIDPKKKSWNEWLEILLNSVEVERRREAVREVARFPWVDPKIPQALLRALGDSDPEVRIIALKVLGREWPDDDSETLIKLARILVRHKDEKLRAVAARVLGRTNHPASVPALIRVIEEPSPYVFREIHNSLNRVTNAYVEVVAPEEMDEAVRKRIGSAWKAWYEANRDRYAKFEEERK